MIKLDEQEVYALAESVEDLDIYSFIKELVSWQLTEDNDVICHTLDSVMDILFNNCTFIN